MRSPARNGAEPQRVTPTFRLSLTPANTAQDRSHLIRLTRTVGLVERPIYTSCRLPFDKLRFDNQYGGMSNAFPANRHAEIRAFFDGEFAAHARDQASLSCLERWVADGEYQGQRRFDLSNNGPHETRLAWSVDL